MLDKLTQQQRMILAVVLSFAFFALYDTYIMPKPQVQDINSTQIVENEHQPSKQKHENSAPQVKTNSVDKVVSAPTTTSKVLVSVKADDFRLSIDTLGRVSSYELISKKFIDEDGNPAKLIDDSTKLKPLEIRFSDSAINNEAFSVEYTADKSSVVLSSDQQSVTLTQKLSSITVTKVITFRSNGTYSVDIKLSTPSEFYITNGSHPVAAQDKFVFSGVIIGVNDGTLEMIEDGDSEGNVFKSHADFLASNDKYYTTVFYDFKDGLEVVVSTDSEENPESFIKSKTNIKLDGYIGDKNFDKLASIDQRLTHVIEYGFFTFISRPMFVFLKYIFSIVGNWGWTIVIATIIIKLVLFPLTFKGMVSMNKLKELSPLVKAIQKEHKGNPQKMNAKMMELYKKNGANPMGGCLPMIMQIPVFFAIYRVLLNSSELKDAPWTMWISDLSAMDPYYVLPILMGGTMFWQQRITPSNFTDPMQEKIMKFLPLIFTFFFVTFPAGLTLYWFVNNLFSVGQQYYVNSIFAKDKKGA